MRIEGSGISCGVRRLIVDNGDQPTKDELDQLLKVNHSCAMVVTGVPTRRKDVISLLLGSGFERMKPPYKRSPDASVTPVYDEFAFLLQHQEHKFNGYYGGTDDDNLFESFVENTVSNDMGEFATSMMHHGNFIGNVGFFVRYMK